MIDLASLEAYDFPTVLLQENVAVIVYNFAEGKYGHHNIRILKRSLAFVALIRLEFDVEFPLVGEGAAIGILVLEAVAGGFVFSKSSTSKLLRVVRNLDR